MRSEIFGPYDDQNRQVSLYYAFEQCSAYYAQEYALELAVLLAAVLK